MTHSDAADADSNMPSPSPVTPVHQQLQRAMHSGMPRYVGIGDQEGILRSHDDTNHVNRRRIELEQTLRTAKPAKRFSLLSFSSPRPRFLSHSSLLSFLPSAVRPPAHCIPLGNVLRLALPPSPHAFCPNDHRCPSVNALPISYPSYDASRAL